MKLTIASTIKYYLNNQTQDWISGSVIEREVPEIHRQRLRTNGFAPELPKNGTINRELRLMSSKKNPKPSLDKKKASNKTVWYRLKERKKKEVVTFLPDGTVKVMYV